MRRARDLLTARPAMPEPSEPAMLYGHVDEPVPGAKVVLGEPVVIRGWHRWGAAPGLAVAASLNGVVIASAVVGNEMRPDVAKSTGKPELAMAGWKMLADCRTAPPGPARLTIVIWPSSDHAPLLAGSLEIAIVEEDDSFGAGETWYRSPTGPVDRFRGGIDLPNGDEADRSVIRIVGWALTEPHPVSRLDVLVNGEDFGGARLGLERPDLWNYFRVPHAAVAGFEHLVDLNKATLGDDGNVTVEIVARTVAAGPETVASRTWRVTETVSLKEAVASKQRSDAESTVSVAGRHARSNGAVSRSQRLHLAAFTHDMGLGGGQLWLSELLTKSGAGRTFDCTIISPREGPLVAEMEKRGVRVHVTQEIPLQRYAEYEGRLAEIGAYLRQTGCNAVLANTFLTFPGVDIAVRMGIPAAWAIHESWEPSAIWSVAYPADYAHPDVRRSAERALHHAQALVFEAEATRLQYVGYAGPGRSLVIPYGVDVGAIREYQRGHDQRSARRELEIPEHVRVLLVMGTTEPRKAQTLLAEAFAQVATKHGDAALVMVGDTGNSYAEALHTFVEKSGIAGQTTIRPVVKDIHRWYQAADVLVCASDVESLPRSVLEAMCFGVPVLATSVFGLGELITDGKTGYLFEPSDLAAATAAVERVLNAPEAELSAVGAGGRELVEAEYDSRWYSTDVVGLIEGLRRDPGRLPAEILATNGSQRWRSDTEPDHR